MTHNEVSGAIVDAALEVHRTLGPGLLESIYQQALAYELRQRGLNVETEVPLPVIYKNIQFDLGYRLDLVVEGAVIVELKSVERLEPVHGKQLLTYLRLADKRLGLLINFNVELLKDGIRRIVNQL
jgi:GxxExxY protein